MLKATAIPDCSHLVRFLVGDGPEYDRMIVVTETDGGETLFLAGWVGPPLTSRQWREARAQLFPDAKIIRFERWCAARASFRTAELRLG